MSIRRALGALVVAAAVLWPAGAEAATPSSAQRFADAALRLKVAINAKEGEIEQAYEDIQLERCRRGMDKAPKRHIERVVTVWLLAAFQPLFDAAAEPMQQMVRDLDAIPTSDPILRSGRAAWRASVTVLITKWPRVDRPCEALERWRRSGYRASMAPKVSLRDFERLSDEGETIDDKFERAAERLRQLGVSRGAAERFTGESTFDDVMPEDLGLFDSETTVSERVIAPA